MTISLIVSVTSLCFCIFGFLILRRYIKQRTTAVELLGEYREEVYRMIAEIDAATDRDFQLIEERKKTLRQILEDTDRRISIYIRELQRSRDGEAMYTSLGRGIRAALDSRPPQLELPLQDSGDAAPETVETQPAVPAAVKRKPKKAKLRVQIAQLSAQGFSPAEIASRLHLSLAEIDLALNLLNRQNTEQA